MPRKKSAKAVAITARIDRRPVIAITAISLLASLILALDLLR